MKKYLITLAGFTGLASSSILTLPSNLSTQNNWIKSPQASPKTIAIQNQVFNEYVNNDNNYIYVTIPINLTNNGIKNLNALHEYDTIELPGIEAKFEKRGTIMTFKGDKWDAKNKKIGNQEWFLTYSDQKLVSGTSYTMTSRIYTAAVLWYDGNGDFIIRLTYKITGFYAHSPILQGINASFKTGSIVKFY